MRFVLSLRVMRSVHGNIRAKRHKLRRSHDGCKFCSAAACSLRRVASRETWNRPCIPVARFRPALPSQSENPTKPAWKMNIMLFLRAMGLLTLASLMMGSFLIAGTFSPARADAIETITFGTVGAGSAMNWPLFVAVAKGFAAKDNVAIETVSLPSSAAVQQALASGAVDVGEGGLVDVLRAIDKGAPVTVLRIQAKSSPYVLIAKPTITAYKMLKGKIISIGGPKDITHIYLDRMLEPHGLKSGDYDLVYAGATNARFAALESGAIDATLLASPFSFKAEGEGFVRLGLSVDSSRDFPYTGYSVNKNWASAHKKAAARFVQLITAGIDWLDQPKNKAEAISILSKASLTAPDDAAKTWDFFQKIKLYDHDGSPDKDGMETLIMELKSLGDIDGDPALARFYDPSILHR
jgi:NitT/TauT family transport system substrate-binding protein